MPTGRFYPFVQYLDKRGEAQWPRTKIINYPVQGLAADLVSIARVSFAKRIDGRVKLVSTVHDSIVVDLPPDRNLVKSTVDTFHAVFFLIASAIFGSTLSYAVRIRLICGSRCAHVRLCDAPMRTPC